MNSKKYHIRFCRYPNPIFRTASAPGPGDKREHPRVVQTLGNNAPLFASTPKDAFTVAGRAAATAMAGGASNQVFRNAQHQQGTDGSFNALMNPPKM